MITNYDQSKKFSLQFSKDIKEICTPILELIGIKGYTFHRMYRDGSRIYLSTSEKWTEHIYNLDLLNASSYNKFSQVNDVMLWSRWPNADYRFQGLIADAKENFGYDNGLHIIKKNDEYLDSFGFRGHAGDHDINNRYLAYFSYIEKFISFFLLKADSLINMGYKNRCIIPETSIPLITTAANVEEDQILFDKAITTNQNIITATKGKILTPRESQCICLMFLGSSSKEMASKMKISIRTVETHISNLKNKLQCFSKAAVMKFIMENDSNKNIIINFLKQYEKSK